MSNSYCECVFVALGTHHAKHMRHIAICGLPAVQLSALFHKRSIFGKKFIARTMCVLIFSTAYG